MIGEIKSFKVDIGDIKSCGKGEYFNSLSTLAHELHEEYLVQGKGVSIEKAHLNACLKEAQLTGGFISPSSRIIEGNIMKIKVTHPQTNLHISTIIVEFDSGNIKNVNFMK